MLAAYTGPGKQCHGSVRAMGDTIHPRTVSPAEKVGCPKNSDDSKDARGHVVAHRGSLMNVFRMNK